MPSGVNSNFTVAVTDGCTNLEIAAGWPSMICNGTKLHKPFQKLLELQKLSGEVDSSLYDLLTRLQEFKKHVKLLEKQMDWMESKTVICLRKPMHVHQIEMNAIGHKDDGTRLLYINLLCECLDSNKQKGLEFFVI